MIVNSSDFLRKVEFNNFDASRLQFTGFVGHCI